MPWWLVRVYADGLDKEFSQEEDADQSDPDEMTDDITQLGITPIQIQ